MRAAMLAFIVSSLLIPGAALSAADEAVFAGKPLSHWVGRLKDDNPLLREEAAAVLGEMGASARAALPALRPLLTEKDARLRVRVAVAVWKIERQSKDVLPVLIDCLRDTNRERRMMALQVLEQMGTAAVPAAPALVVLLDDEESQTRWRASAALRQLGVDALPALTVGLKERGAEGRYYCVQLLNSFSFVNPKVADLLVERLKDEDKKVRLEAARSLLLSVPHRKAVVAALTEAIEDKDVLHRRQAATAVFGVSPRPREFLAIFDKLLDDPDAQVAGTAAQAVWELSKDGKRVTPTLNRVLRETDVMKHFAAFNTLRQMGPAALPCLSALLYGPAGEGLPLGDIVKQIGPAALPELLSAVAVSNTAKVRRKAAAALGYAGPEALPQLLRLLDDANPRIRDAAIRSLGAVGPMGKEALPALVKIVKEENVSFRSAAVSSIGKLGAEAKPAIPLLLECLKDTDVSVRNATVIALGQVPLDLKSALPALDAAIKADTVSYTRCQMAMLRLKLDADPTPVLPLLAELLKDVGHQQQVVLLLGQSGPKARAALPQLMELAKGNQTFFYQVQLITALVQIDPEVKTIAPALVELMRHRDRAVRLAAIAALSKSGQECDVAPLMAELRTNDVFARQALHKALRQFGPKAKGATPALLEIVRGPDGPMRLEAAETLCKVAPEHVEIGKRVLLDSLGEGKTARFDVARALLSVDEKNEPVLKLFEEALKSDEPQRRFTAANALTQADPSARGVLPHLKPLLKDKEFSVRLLAIRAHWRISGETEPAVTEFCAVLQDKAAISWHYSAVFYVGEIGPAAKPALPILLAMLKERPPRLRTEVLTALRKIDPEAAKTAECSDLLPTLRVGTHVHPLCGESGKRWIAPGL